MNSCMVASSASTMSLQRIAEASSNGIKWLQFDPIKDKQLMIPFLEEAKSGNYSALVITLDTGSGIMKAADIDPMIDFRNRAPLPENVTLPNVGIVVSASEEMVTNPEVWFYEIQDGSPNWRELIQWIRSICNLPIVLKGIMSVEDAIMATNLNVDGILVSNHGGRSIDGVPATVSLLNNALYFYRSPLFMFLYLVHDNP